jgi:hypothetical protein
LDSLHISILYAGRQMGWAKGRRKRWLEQHLHRPPPTSVRNRETEADGGGTDGLDVGEHGLCESYRCSSCKEPRKRHTSWEPSKCNTARGRECSGASAGVAGRVHEVEARQARSGSVAARVASAWWRRGEGPGSLCSNCFREGRRRRDSPRLRRACQCISATDTFNI